MTERGDSVLWCESKVWGPPTEEGFEIFGAPPVPPLVGNPDTFLENNHFDKRKFMLPK